VRFPGVARGEVRVVRRGKTGCALPLHEVTMLNERRKHLRAPQREWSSMSLEAHLSRLAWCRRAPNVRERGLLPSFVGGLGHSTGHVMGRPEVHGFPSLHGRDQGL
jgi:hypothetical protein